MLQDTESIPFGELAATREPGALVYRRAAVHNIAAVVAMNSTAENAGGEAAVKIFAEGDPKVLIAYFLAFGIWTAAAANDFISSTWRTVHRTRRRGKIHVALTFFPMLLIGVYAYFQHRTGDYKEMGAALLAFAFAGLHLSRTFMGLWQLHVFKQWTISSVKSMESLGYTVNDGDEDDSDDGVEDDSDDADEDHDGLLQWVFADLQGVLSFLHKMKAKIFPCTKKGRIERFADNMRVSEAVIDNRLSDVHTVCSFRLLSKEENATVRKTKAVFKRLCLRYLYRVWNTLRFFRVLLSLVFLENPDVPNSISGPRLLPRNPESVWLNWATALVAQAGWMLQDAAHLDPNPCAGYAENRKRFAEQVLLSASLHTQRMRTTGTSTSNGHGLSDRMAGLLSFRDWHDYPKLCNGKFSKQEWLKRACKTGNGLPYRMWHRKAKEGKGRWGYSNFKSELQRACEALPPELETRVKGFDVEMLEWFTIFVSVENWGSGDVEHDRENSPSGSNIKPGVEENDDEAENEIAVENLKKQLGFAEEPNVQEQLGTTKEAICEKQFGCAEEPKFILGSSKLPFLRRVTKAILWGNRSVLEISCHIDNWIALWAGEQTCYMVERVSRMKQELRSAYALRNIEAIVDESAKFETCRLFCQMAVMRPEHSHFEKSMTFVGCSMEMLRSCLAKWAETHRDNEEGTWKPRLNDIVSGTSTKGSLSRLKGSDDFTSCVRSVKSQAAMSKSFVKMRVLWELQNQFQTHLREKEFAPNSLEAIALCILSFPAVSVEVRERRETSINPRRVRRSASRFFGECIEVVQGREECIVALHEDDEEYFRMEKYEYVICASCGPQDLQLILSFEALEEKSNAALSMLLCAMEDGEVDYFDWEVWRNAFYGRLEGCRQWKEKVGISNFALITPTEHINAGIKKVARSTNITDIERDTCTGMSVWKGWPPYCTSICMYELTSEAFILERSQVEGEYVPLSMGEGTTFKINIPQEIWEPVKYAAANESSFKRASVVAQKLLAGKEHIAVGDASDTDSGAVHGMEVGERDVEALEQEILLLQSSTAKREAAFRGVALLERFYVYGTHRPEMTRRSMYDLVSFFCNEKYVKTVTSLFEKLFEASECDKHVAERFQRFLILGMRYGEKVRREQALQVMFRSIVCRCYGREVSESAATILVSLLPFHSNGSFEEYAALTLAYLNARKEVEAALRRRTGHDSRLKNIQHDAKMRLGIVTRGVLRKEGGVEFLEALGLSAEDAATEDVVYLLLPDIPDVYRPSVGVPALADTDTVNFGARDETGRPATPEGRMKQMVLSDYYFVTAAAEVMEPGIGSVGMGGVGKTVALQGLGHDEDVKKRFDDGVHYMTFGRGATLQTAIGEIARIMTLTGACTRANYVRSATSLRQAVDYAIMWFGGRSCLYLLDDVWPAETLPPDYFQQLRKLLRGSPNSRMAISTRSGAIASEADCTVDFGAREPLGAVSVSIFMKYAACSMTLRSALDSGDDLHPAMSKILTWCGGLPIALSVAGSTVALLVRKVGSVERACEMYVNDFAELETKVGDERDGRGTRLSDSIRLSLKYLDVEFSKWKESQSEDTRYTMSDLYTSLCVLTNQVWIPVSALSRMWQLSEESALDVVKLFCRLRLAALSFRRIGDGSVEKAGLTLHDLHLEFCKQQARSERSDGLWHSALLKGYFDTPSDFAFVDASCQSSQQVVDVRPRPWWSVPEDGYIHANVARHLLACDQGAELAGLLLDARWANAQGKLGGMVGLKADFEILDKLLEGDDSGDGDTSRSQGIRKSLQFVGKAMQHSWGRFSDGRRPFQFETCGRLLSLRNGDVILDAAIKSFEAHTPKPYLMPMSSFSVPVLEIPVGSQCKCVACSPCGRYFAAGAGNHILIADAVTGDVVQRLKGHRDDVRCVRFTAGSKKIVSASDDRTVAVWAWENSDEPILVLKGHRYRVRSVDVSSDGERIISGSDDDTVRLWNGLTGRATGEFAQSSEFASRSDVWCVALCWEDKKVAIGVWDGTVKVLDSCTGDIVFEDTEAHSGPVTSIAFSSDGGCMATCSEDETIRVWDAETWAAIGSPVAGHTSWVRSVAFSPDGRQLVSGSDDKTVRLWDVARAESVGASSNHPILSERNVFYTSGGVRSVTFTCDGERLVSASDDDIVRIWDAAFVSEQKQRSFGHSEAVYCVAISPDGLRVATGSEDGTVRLWDSQTGAPTGIALEGHIRDVFCVSFSPNGRRLVSGAYDWRLRMWDTETFTQIGNPLEGHSGWVRCASFSSDGLRIISGGNDETVRSWNVETREQIGDPLIGHTHRVLYVSESSDGRFVVSRDKNRETIIWNRNGSGIVWRSGEYDSGANNNGMTNIEAESIIRSCGHETADLWPSCFPDDTREMFPEDRTLYSKLNGDKTPLGKLPFSIAAWKYGGEAKVFAAEMSNGDAAVCRLVV